MMQPAIVSLTCNCWRHQCLGLTEETPEAHTEDQTAECVVDRDLQPEAHVLPRAPAMWSLGDIGDKTEGIMHLSMGIQKAVFKFIICWATGHTLGGTLQRRLAENLCAIQALKVACCPCRPHARMKNLGDSQLKGTEQ